MTHMILEKLNDWIEFIENQPLEKVSASDAFLYMKVVRAKKELENRICKNLIDGEVLPF